MNLVETYLENNGYDCNGNTAEDTLVFFVQDEDAPEEEAAGGRSNEAITNLSDDTVNGIAGGLSAEAAATNTETHAEAYKENGKDTSQNFSIGRDNALANDEYSDALATGSLAASGASEDTDELGDSVPKMAEADPKQTNTEHSTDAGFKA